MDHLALAQANLPRWPVWRGSGLVVSASRKLRKTENAKDRMDGLVISRHMLSPWTKIIISPSAGVYYWQRAFRCVLPLQNQLWQFAKRAWSHGRILWATPSLVVDKPFFARLLLWPRNIGTPFPQPPQPLKEGHCGASTGHVRWLHGNHLAGSGQPGLLRCDAVEALTKPLSLRYLVIVIIVSGIFRTNPCFFEICRGQITTLHFV